MYPGYLKYLSCANPPTLGRVERLETLSWTLAFGKGDRPTHQIDPPMEPTVATTKAATKLVARLRLRLRPPLPDLCEELRQKHFLEGLEEDLQVLLAGLELDLGKLELEMELKKLDLLGEVE